MKRCSSDHRGARVAALAALALPFVGACANSDTALFATNSSLGIDFDSKPPLASIGYDRTEGYIGPRYDDGTVPPVVASIRSKSTFLRGNAQQLYATGDAAIIVQDEPLDDAREALAGNSKLMFFGTNTNVGMRVGFTQTLPDSFSFGYKRQEVSVIPLAKIEEAKEGRPAKHSYPSVLASVDTTGSGESGNEGGFDIVQFFATGSAAKKLAQKPEIRQIFEDSRDSALGVYRQSVAAQSRFIIRSLVCYQAILPAAKPNVWKNADQLGLLGGDPDQLNKLNAAYELALAATTEDAKATQLGEVHRKYAILIGLPRGQEEVRAALLEAHSKFVCGLRKDLTAAQAGG